LSQRALAIDDVDSQAPSGSRNRGEVQGPVFVHVGELAEQPKGRGWIRSAFWLQAEDAPFNLGGLSEARVHSANYWVWGRVCDWELRGLWSATHFYIDRRATARLDKRPREMVERVAKVLNKIANHQAHHQWRLSHIEMEDVARSIQVDIGAYEVRVFVFVPSDLIVDELQVVVGPPDLSFDPGRQRDHGTPAYAAASDGAL